MLSQATHAAPHEPRLTAEQAALLEIADRLVRMEALLARVAAAVPAAAEPGPGFRSRRGGAA